MLCCDNLRMVRMMKYRMSAETTKMMLLNQGWSWRHCRWGWSSRVFHGWPWPWQRSSPTWPTQSGSKAGSWCRWALSPKPKQPLYFCLRFSFVVVLIVNSELLMFVRKVVSSSTGCQVTVNWEVLCDITHPEATDFRITPLKSGFNTVRLRAESREVSPYLTLG